jgi:hypothetical protein
VHFVSRREGRGVGSSIQLPSQRQVGTIRSFQRASPFPLARRPAWIAFEMRPLSPKQEMGHLPSMNLCDQLLVFSATCNQTATSVVICIPIVRSNSDLRCRFGNYHLFVTATPRLTEIFQAANFLASRSGPNLPLNQSVLLAYYASKPLDFISLQKVVIEPRYAPNEPSAPYVVSKSRAQHGAC